MIYDNFLTGFSIHSIQDVLAKEWPLLFKKERMVGLKDEWPHHLIHLKDF